MYQWCGFPKLFFINYTQEISRLTNLGYKLNTRQKLLKAVNEKWFLTMNYPIMLWFLLKKYELAANTMTI